MAKDIVKSNKVSNDTKINGVILDCEYYGPSLKRHGLRRFIPKNYPNIDAINIDTFTRRYKSEKLSKKPRSTSNFKFFSITLSAAFCSSSLSSTDKLFV